jgi:UDP-N-acetylmuramoylalanine--D-glutamate ligase
MARTLAGKKVAVLGLARQGVALVRYLVGKGARVIVSDVKPAEALQVELQALSGMKVDYRLGGHPLEILDGADLLCLSGGVPAELPKIGRAHV